MAAVVLRARRDLGFCPVTGQQLLGQFQSSSGSGVNLSLITSYYLPLTKPVAIHTPGIYSLNQSQRDIGSKESTFLHVLEKYFTNFDFTGMGF